MKTTIQHGQTSVHRNKGVGSHVTILIAGEAAGEWDGVYRFGSHGMTADEFVARVFELKAYHAAKMARLNGFRELRMRDVIVAGTKYRIIDANIIERGADVELRLGVFEIGPLGHQAFSFALGHMQGLIFPSIEAVPDDDTIETMVRRHLGHLGNLTSLHDTLKASIAGKMGA